jgi:hypothetical protein
LGDEGSSVHAALCRKGSQIINASSVWPCCMSSVNSVSQPASIAAAAMTGGD